MPDLLHVLILFAAGVLGGTMNVMAGGGSTITLPVLLFLGLDGATANGTNRVALLIQNVSAVSSFHHEKVSRFRRSLQLALPTIPGAVAGAVAAVQISDAWFERILGIVMIGVVVSMVVPRGDKATTPEGISSGWAYLFLFGIGFYGGFIQVGVGFMLMAVLYHLLRMDLVFVNMHKVTIVLIYMLPALAIFAWTGHVDWVLGLVLAVGNATGAWWAARLAVRGGERVIRIVLMGAVLVLALKVLGVF